MEFHGHPKRLVDSDSSLERYRRLSHEVDIVGVYNLELADFLGRIAADKASALSVLKSFKSKCLEYNVFGKPYEIPNNVDLPILVKNNARWQTVFGYMEENDPEEMAEMNALYEKQPFEFVLLVGPPASGKTTYRQNMSNFKVICMDDERQRLCGTPNDMSKNAQVFNNCFSVLNKAFKARENVVWDATSFTRKARKTLLNMARQHGAFITIVHFDFPLPILLERNAIREKKVPEDVVRGFYKRMESPKIYEYDKLIVVDK